jgi:hypothetical protein
MLIPDADDLIDVVELKVRPSNGSLALFAHVFQLVKVGLHCDRPFDVDELHAMNDGALQRSLFSVDHCATCDVHAFEY